MEKEETSTSREVKSKADEKQRDYKEFRETICRECEQKECEKSEKDIDWCSERETIRKDIEQLWAKMDRENAEAKIKHNQEMMT